MSNKLFGFSVPGKKLLQVRFAIGVGTAEAAFCAKYNAFRCMANAVMRGHAQGFFELWDGFMSLCLSLHQLDFNANTLISQR